jgi:phosphoglycolate phosphatase
MSINAFLFDLDGTLVDTIPDLTRSVNLLRDEFGLSPVSCEQVRGYVGDGVGLLVQRALPEGLYSDAARHRFMAIYTEHLCDDSQVYPGIVTFLESLRGCPMAVVTNKPQQLAELLIEQLGLTGFFQAVVGVRPARRRKPHPEMLLMTMALLTIDPARTVLLGDHHVDLRAADAAGIRSCFCAWGLGHDDGLEADFVATLPSDLPQLFGETFQP